VLQLQPPSLVTSTGLGRTPSVLLALLRSNQMTIEQNRMTLQPSAKRIYNLLFPRGLHIQTAPYFRKSFTHWWITPVYAKGLLVKCNRLALLYFHHILRKGPVYPCMDMFVKQHGESQGLLQEAWCIKLRWVRLLNSSVVYQVLMQLLWTEQTSSPQLPFDSTCIQIQYKIYAQKS
jgi:hypothetical protein